MAATPPGQSWNSIEVCPKHEVPMSSPQMLWFLGPVLRRLQPVNTPHRGRFERMTVYKCAGHLRVKRVKTASYSPQTSALGEQTMIGTWACIGMMRILRGHMGICLSIYLSIYPSTYIVCTYVYAWNLRGFTRTQRPLCDFTLLQFAKGKNELDDGLRTYRGLRSVLRILARSVQG